MKRLFVGAAFAAFLCSQAMPADANSEFKAFMMKMQSRVERAFAQKDWRFFESISTPDFTYRERGRTTTRKQSMEQMKQGFAACESMSGKFKLLSSRVSGNTATAMLSGHFVMKLKPTKKGQKGSVMTSDMWTKETWVRSGNTWKIKKIEEVKPSKMTMDGKPVDPSKMGGG